MSISPAISSAISSAISKILNKTDKSKIFAAFFKAIESLEHTPLDKVVTSLVTDKALDEAKLALFIKLAPQDQALKSDLALNICNLLSEMDKTTIEYLLNYAPKQHLQNIVEAIEQKVPYQF